VSLPEYTHEYNSEVNRFRRYSAWLKNRNRLIEGFTEHDNNYFTWLLIDAFTIIATVTLDMDFAPHVEYSSCVMHKQLSDGWTSNSISLLKNLNYMCLFGMDST